MKVYNLVIKQEAKTDISDAFLWYKNKQEKLGEMFLNALEKRFLIIIKNPELFAKKHNDMRQVSVKKFPYVVIYEIENDNIVVFAVFNTSRNPDIWKQRIK